jgi:hypothetical protein
VVATSAARGDAERGQQAHAKSDIKPGQVDIYIYIYVVGLSVVLGRVNLVNLNGL